MTNEYGDEADYANSTMWRYKDLLKHVLAAPSVPSVASELSIGSRWGAEPLPFRELIGCCFRVEGAAYRLVSNERPMNYEFAIVSSVWIILGRSDVESVARYNSTGRQFTTDGFTLSAAFGYRLRTDNGDQIEAVVRLLRTDRSSRRATAFIGKQTDVLCQSRDYPCASVVQFLLRDDGVHLVVFMRSQSIFGVFPYDLVNFRYLQEYVAWRLGEASAGVHFMFGSLHIYEHEVARVERFLRDESARFVILAGLPWERLEDVFDDWTRGPEGEHKLAAFIDGGRK